MNFSTDRDLLRIEPNVFTEASLVGQQRLYVTDGQLSGTALTSPTADFVDAGVEAGSVVLAAQSPLEVIERLDPQTLAVSLIRTKPTDALIPPSGLGAGPLEVKAITFELQAALVRDSLLRVLGLDPDGIDPETPDADAVVSEGVMWQLEALGTLERVYASAAVFDEPGSALAHKAAYYRQRFDELRQRAIVLLDLDGDGLADERRGLGLITLTRV